jgi:hypothetical protein
MRAHVRDPVEEGGLECLHLDLDAGYAALSRLRGLVVGGVASAAELEEGLGRRCGRGLEREDLRVLLCVVVSLIYEIHKAEPLLPFQPQSQLARTYTSRLVVTNGTGSTRLLRISTNVQYYSHRTRID